MIIAFDADDTLWHNEDGFQASHREFEALLAPWAEADTVEAHLTEVQRRNLPRYGFGAKAYMLSMIETALDLTDHAVPAPVTRRILELGHAILDRPTELLDGVVEVLDELAGRQLMVITKGDLYAQLARLADSGLTDRFFDVEVVAHKDPGTYRTLLARHRIDPAEFVMVGNSLKSDVLPVVEVGGRAVHIPYHVTWSLEEVDHDHDHEFVTLDTLRELPALLAEWG